MFTIQQQKVIESSNVLLNLGPFYRGMSVCRVISMLLNNDSILTKIDVCSLNNMLLLEIDRHGTKYTKIYVL